MAEQFKIRNTWRVKKMHQAPPPPKVLGPVPADDVDPTRIFDQLSIIGDTFVWCFVLETTEGLILIDCLYPYQKYVDMIEDGLRKLELDPANIKAILITHGHFDHIGAVNDILAVYPGVPVHIHPLDVQIAFHPATARQSPPTGTFIAGNLSYDDFIWSASPQTVHEDQV